MADSRKHPRASSPETEPRPKKTSRMEFTHDVPHTRSKTAVQTLEDVPHMSNTVAADARPSSHLVPSDAQSHPPDTPYVAKVKSSVAFRDEPGSSSPVPQMSPQPMIARTYSFTGGALSSTLTGEPAQHGKANLDTTALSYRRAQISPENPVILLLDLHSTPCGPSAVNAHGVMNSERPHERGSEKRITRHQTKAGQTEPMISPMLQDSSTVRDQDGHAFSRHAVNGSALPAQIDRPPQNTTLDQPLSSFLNEHDSTRRGQRASKTTSFLTFDRPREQVFLHTVNEAALAIRCTETASGKVREYIFKKVSPVDWSSQQHISWIKEWQRQVYRRGGLNMGIPGAWDAYETWWLELFQCLLAARAAKHPSSTTIPSTHHILESFNAAFGDVDPNYTKRLFSAFVAKFRSRTLPKLLKRVKTMIPDSQRVDQQYMPMVTRGMLESFGAAKSLLVHEASALNVHLNTDSFDVDLQQVHDLMTGQVFCEDKPILEVWVRFFQRIENLPDSMKDFRAGTGYNGLPKLPSSQHPDAEACTPILGNEVESSPEREAPSHEVPIAKQGVNFLSQERLHDLIRSSIQPQLDALEELRKDPGPVNIPHPMRWEDYEHMHRDSANGAEEYEDDNHRDSENEGVKG